MQIASVLRLPDHLLTDGEYGVEIETEGDDLPNEEDIDQTIWRVDTDGSLRGEAWEYVMPKPRSLEGVKDALIYLEDKMGDSTIHTSIRPGVHVHMNVQSLSMKQLFTLITSYFIVEDLLVKWCGENREGNLFCLRSKDAEYVIFQIAEAIKHRKLSFLDTQMLRYCSLNVTSLFKYGSLEFRAMRGTDDFNSIYEWTTILDELKSGASNFFDPMQMIYSVSGDGEETFLRRLFPTKYHHFTQVDGWKRLLRQGVRRAQLLAFSTEDWASFDRPNKNPFKT